MEVVDVFEEVFIDYQDILIKKTNNYKDIIEKVNKIIVGDMFCSDIVAGEIIIDKGQVEKITISLGSSDCKEFRMKEYEISATNNEGLKKYSEIQEEIEKNDCFEKIMDKKFGKIDNEYKKKIVLIIESPHTKEYNDENGDFPNRITPARGDTGLNIKYLLKEILNKFNKTISKDKKIEDGEYTLILMNSIQYPCSLLTDTNYFRSKIFIRMWEEQDVKDDFTNRLKNYNPDIIINACTGGNGVGSLRSKVEDEIKNIPNINNIRLLKSYHPSYWDKKSNLE